MPRRARPDESFTSLVDLLEGLFDKSLLDLPVDIAQRVAHDLSPLPWDRLSHDQRRNAAQQWDYQNDPATEAERESWWQFFSEMTDVERQIADWERSSSTSAEGLGRKAHELARLRRQLAKMKARAQAAPPPSARAGSRARQSAVERRFVPFPMALQRLDAQLGASADEIAAWVYMGPEHGGLSAYLNANELDPPPRFHYGALDAGDGFDYLAPLMACWFDETELTRFNPVTRYLSGKELIERWSKAGIQPHAFIIAKIEESRLIDLHPIFGSTRGGSNDSYRPPLEMGLFSRTDIENVEAEDFGVAARDSAKAAALPPQGSAQWFAQRGRQAASALHDKPGGSREKQQRIRAIWASGKYSSRDRCAEEECAGLDMSFKAARNALVRAPEPATRAHQSRQEPKGANRVAVRKPAARKRSGG